MGTYNPYSTPLKRAVLTPMQATTHIRVVLKREVDDDDLKGRSFIDVICNI